MKYNCALLFDYFSTNNSGKYLLTDGLIVFNTRQIVVLLNDLLIVSPTIRLELFDNFIPGKVHYTTGGKYEDDSYKKRKVSIYSRYYDNFNHANY